MFLGMVGPDNNRRMGIADILFDPWMAGHIATNEEYQIEWEKRFKKMQETPS